MFAEDGAFLVDRLKQERATARRADVFGIGFRGFPERLLIDTRAGEEVAPLVAVVPPVASLTERVFWLGQHRPSLGMPRRLGFFMWGYSIEALAASDLWTIIRRRLTAHDPALNAALDGALDGLRDLERQAVRDAITGTGHGTLWERQGSPHHP